jgi:hypothetical protein
MLDKIEALPERLGAVDTLLADAGYFSAGSGEARREVRRKRRSPALRPPSWVGSSGFADELVWGEAHEGFELLDEVTKSRRPSIHARVFIFLRRRE